MQIYYKSFFLIMCLVPVVTMPVYAVQHINHSHDKKKTIPATSASLCPTNTTKPELRCTNVLSLQFDKYGKLWLVWYQNGYIYVSFSTDKGRTYRQITRVNRIQEKIYARGENRPKIAIGNNGNIYVSWTQRLTKRFSGNIRFSRSVDNGKHFSDPITVNDHKGITGHRFDALAVTNKGHIYLAWLDKRDLVAAKKSGSKYRGAALYFALSTDNGKSFRTNKKIVDHTCQCCRVAIAIDNDHLPVVIWRHIYGKNIRDHSMTKFVGPEQPGKPVRVSYDNWKIDACPHHGPTISVAKDGIYHITWFNNAPLRFGLFYARSLEQGRRFSTPVNFGNHKNHASHPSVLSTGEHVFVTWKEFDGKKSLLYVMQSNNKGKHWTRARRLAESDVATDYPFLLTDGKLVFISWHRRGIPFQLISVTMLKAK